MVLPELFVYKTILIGVIFQKIYVQGSGPTCFSCAKTYTPEDCNVTTTCTSSQACSIQQIFALHGDVYFWSGCEEMGTCDELTYFGASPNIVGRRRQEPIDKAGRCLYCCTTNLCNRNCSAFTNLALHKPAYQSSLRQPSVAGANHGLPSLAVDGNTDQNWFHGSCTHTTEPAELYPWWAVDLLHAYHLSNVKIFNRNDVPDRDVHLKILVSSVNATTLPKDSISFTTCGQYTGHSGDGNIITIHCPSGTTGRWIRIQSVSTTNEYLHMCEVEVYGF